MNILTMNLVLGTLVFWTAARIYLVPQLARLRPETVLVPILLLHASRHLGFMFLAPGAALEGMPRAFAVPAAYGDLLAAALAMATLLAGTPRPLVWIFNVVGTADLLLAIALAVVYGAADFMGAAYWIPAFWVPALLVTHYLVFVILTRRYIGNRRAAGLKPS
jgi:hypothetical protein